MHKLNAIDMSEPGGALQVVPPRAILLQRPRVLQQGRDHEVLLELVIDEAGKVRSVEPAGPAKNLDAELINAALSWKFIPALRNGRAVASRFRLALSGKE